MLNFAKFCETKEDFHNIYGLSLEGVDPTVLSDKLISDVDWMTVYTVPRVKGKVKLKHVRADLYDDCMRLHQKVHQEIPVNNELSVSFARAFAYEYCKTAKESRDPEMYRVAWAVYGEASVERCRKMGTLAQKIDRFWSMAGVDATADEEQNRGDTPHRHPSKANVDDTGETLVSYMLKNVQEACETLAFFKTDLEKATMASAMESKVYLAVTTIRNKIQVTIVLLVCDCVINNFKGKIC